MKTPRISTPRSTEIAIAASGLAACGAIIFVLSRLLIEVLRIANASERDTDLAVILLWSTTITVVVAVGGVLLGLWLAADRARRRNDAVCVFRPRNRRAEVDRLHPVLRQLAQAGAPRSLTGFNLRDVSFTIVFTNSAMEFWIGSDRPTCVWELPWERVLRVEKTQLHLGIHSWWALSLAMVSVIRFETSI